MPPWSNPSCSYTDATSTDMCPGASSRLVIRTQLDTFFLVNKKGEWPVIPIDERAAEIRAIELAR